MFDRPPGGRDSQITLSFDRQGRCSIPKNSSDDSGDSSSSDSESDSSDSDESDSDTGSNPLASHLGGGDLSNIRISSLDLSQAFSQFEKKRDKAGQQEKERRRSSKKERKSLSTPDIKKAVSSTEKKRSSERSNGSTKPSSSKKNYSSKRSEPEKTPELSLTGLTPANSGGKHPMGWSAGRKKPMLRSGREMRCNNGAVKTAGRPGFGASRLNKGSNNEDSTIYRGGGVKMVRDEGSGQKNYMVKTGALSPSEGSDGVSPTGGGAAEDLW